MIRAALLPLLLAGCAAAPTRPMADGAAAAPPIGAVAFCAQRPKPVPCR